MQDGFKENGPDFDIPTGLAGGFFIYEAEGEETLLYADQNVARLFDCEDFSDLYEFVGGSFKGMVHPQDLRRVENEIQAQTFMGDKRHDYVRYRILTRQGETRYLEDFGHLLHRSNGQSYFYVFVVDVDQNEYFNRYSNSAAEAEVLAGHGNTDALTGLLKMSFFYETIQQILFSPQGRRTRYALVYFDIPNFKLFNERMGYSEGDAVLCELAQTIHAVFAGDLASRFSDDHFMVFATGPRNKVVEKVEEVCHRMLRTDDVRRKVRVQAGIYFMGANPGDAGLACDHARLACNSIKNRHDVHCCIYDESMRERLRRQQHVVDHIGQAIEQKYLKVYYQPVIRVHSGEICGYEALVRWIDPDIGMLPPGDFIETLEQYHLIHILDQYVIRQVCEDYRALADAGKPLVPVSVNVSRIDFEVCDIVGYIEQTRREFGMPREMLDIEITESALSEDANMLRVECDRIKELGYQLWLDDFGSGYSSLNVLADFSFDVLKLDLVFLRSRERTFKTSALMNYIIQGARGMGLLALCEGVETEEQYHFLKAIGCERAQGYYFGKPMPMEETRALTEAKGMCWESPGRYRR